VDEATALAGVPPVVVVVVPAAVVALSAEAPFVAAAEGVPPDVTGPPLVAPVVPLDNISCASPEESEQPTRAAIPNIADK